MAKGKTKKELAIVDEDTKLPAYLNKVDRGSGMDSMGVNDMVVPRIKLLQGISPEVQDFDEAKAGLFWHSIADSPMGDHFDFIVIKDRKRYLLSAPLSDGQGILARADDAKKWDRMGKWTVKIKNFGNVEWGITDLNVERSGLANWGTSIPTNPDSPPAATLFYEYLVDVPGRPDLSPAVMLLARSQIRPARKQLNAKLEYQFNLGRPTQAVVMTASSVEEMGDEGPYMNLSFRQARFANEKEYERAMDLRERYSDYAVHDEESAAIGDSDESADADSNKF